MLCGPARTGRESARRRKISDKFARRRFRWVLLGRGTTGIGMGAVFYPAGIGARDGWFPPHLTQDHFRTVGKTECRPFTLVADVLRRYAPGLAMAGRRKFV
jgi:hypothetical protein